MRRFQRITGQLQPYDLSYEATPSDIDQAIREKQPPKEMPKGVAFDQILDVELVEKVMR
ncbi:MAG: hypothetical protein ABSH20_22105 [Tepidisphaeraceae bacterium]